MNEFKKIGLLIVGWIFIGLGVLGLFLPILQGILFIMIGLAILSSRMVSPSEHLALPLVDDIVEGTRVAKLAGHIGDLVTGLWVLEQEHVNTVIATLDGKKFFELDIGGGEDLKALDHEMSPAVDRLNAQIKNIEFTTTAGVHRIGVTFKHRSFAESDRQLRSLVPGGGQDAVMMIRLVEVFGPVNATGLSRTASREKIYSHDRNIWHLSHEGGLHWSVNQHGKMLRADPVIFSLMPDHKQRYFF